MPPALGAYGVVRTNGWAADAIQWITDSRWNHAVLYVGDGQIVQASPSGAALAPWDSYGVNVVWSERHIQGHGQAIATYGRTLVGRPYGFPDIVAIGLAQERLGSRVDVRKALKDQPWWVRRIERTDRLICSQLVDLAYEMGGVKLFDDGRIPGLVSPGDLALIA